MKKSTVESLKKNVVKGHLLPEKSKIYEFNGHNCLISLKSKTAFRYKYCEICTEEKKFNNYWEIEILYEPAFSKTIIICQSCMIKLANTYIGNFEKIYDTLLTKGTGLNKVIEDILTKLECSYIQSQKEFEYDVFNTDIYDTVFGKETMDIVRSSLTKQNNK